jgi:hypothetical protein
MQGAEPEQLGLIKSALERAETLLKTMKISSDEYRIVDSVGSFEVRFFKKKGLK